ncbi:DUF4912 domain-containing protein [Cyanobacterium sp. uoEpiScrs1]|uniref:DUF4912 domain-containing protein n=1 Tax=Cyanobacterium sp. uoEpiScrs1 TaxID=2976343 RepID=UPI00226A446D|nr:DUF4912 domain-containing protein [Cyanobacterium sp. uoEpiScrs1]
MAQEQLLLEKMTFRQLRRAASKYNIPRYGRMRKAQLLSALKQQLQEQTVQQPKIKKTIINPTLVKEKQRMEASKFEIGQDNIVERILSSVDNELSDPLSPADDELGDPLSSVDNELSDLLSPVDDELSDPLSSVDDELSDLPDGYGESRIVILPRDPQWAYAYWDAPNSSKEELRRQGGQQLALRLYDVTDIDLNSQSPHSVQEYLCDELTREWYLSIPVSDRDYVLDIGYRCFDGRWLILARSASVHIPPIYPSDWVEDIFVTVNSNQELQDKMVYNLVSPAHPKMTLGNSLVYNETFDTAKGVNKTFDTKKGVNKTFDTTKGVNKTFDTTKGVNKTFDTTKGVNKTFNTAKRVEDKCIEDYVFGSIQHVAGSEVNSYVHQEVVSSYVFPPGIGTWAVPSASGLNPSNMSGVGLGVSVSASSENPRKFWLVADAELIVYGATEPDATVTIGGRPIELNPDGTFRFQMSFQDGLIDYPIMAVAVDGKQTRSIQMKFNRETPENITNTREKSVLDWFSI